MVISKKLNRHFTAEYDVPLSVERAFFLYCMLHLFFSSNLIISHQSQVDVFVSLKYLSI